ncbi:interferon gamma receptor 2 precursor [Cynoglossus semilaevis]|uniref:Interferon gamma receptor 2 n=1 Tax=Cynoglossus semilaevis TaxID=244447 RepID=A0A3P8X3G6_CYNSE|nr:interferon gamma receptor 2 precursor [Cynoglossus semilaevis]
MLLVLLSFQALVQVSVVSQKAPQPPINILADEWLLTWSSTDENDVTYTVQYLSFDHTVWKDVASCVQTSFTSCNVAFTKADSEHGCVNLRVQAERSGLKSQPVQACSRRDTCSPDVMLAARPGSLTVYLSKNHTLALEHADHVEHRVYYGKEGKGLQKYKDGYSSLSINKLEEGQSYCVEVQYMYSKKPVGLRSCRQCEVIPLSKHKPNPTLVVVVIVVLFILVLVISAVAYTIICHSRRIKQCLQNPFEIPENLHFDVFPEQCVLSVEEEHCDVISSLQ